MSFRSYESYPNKGKLGSALIHFKLAICNDHHSEWPRYWREFADQAFADLIALETEMKFLREKADKYDSLCK